MNVIYRVARAWMCIRKPWWLVRSAAYEPLRQEVRTFAITISGLLPLSDWLESFGVWHVLEEHFEL